LVERDGNILRYRAHFAHLHKLTDYLWEDCCKGGSSSDCAKSDPGCAPPSSPKPRPRRA
jgi:hypothetical protein